jgi:hypothetical protein
MCNTEKIFDEKNIFKTFRINPRKSMPRYIMVTLLRVKTNLQRSSSKTIHYL